MNFRSFHCWYLCFIPSLARVLVKKASSNKNKAAVGTEMIASSSTSLLSAGAAHTHVLFSERMQAPEQYPSPQSNGDCISHGSRHPQTPLTATQSNPVSGHTPVHGTFNPSHRGAGGVGVVVGGAVVPVVVRVVEVDVGVVDVVEVVVCVVVEVAGLVDATVLAVVVKVVVTVVVVGLVVVAVVVLVVVGDVVVASGVHRHQQSNTPGVGSASDRGAGRPA